MSYTPTEWETGDVVTAEKLNKLEGGVQKANLHTTPFIKVNQIEASQATHTVGTIFYGSYYDGGIESTNYFGISYIEGNADFTLVAFENPTYLYLGLPTIEIPNFHESGHTLCELISIEKEYLSNISGDVELVYEGSNYKFFKINGDFEYTMNYS